MTEKQIELFVIVGPFGNLGAWHNTAENGHLVEVECVHAFTSEADAWKFVLGATRVSRELREQHERAMRKAWRVLRVSASISCEEWDEGVKDG